MGYYAIVRGEDQIPLASLSGWENFKHWSETLPLPAYQSIVELAEHAVTPSAPQLRRQLVRSLSTNPPDDVRSTVQSLIDSLGDRRADGDSVFVSDGTGN